MSYDDETEHEVFLLGTSFVIQVSQIANLSLSLFFCVCFGTCVSFSLHTHTFHEV